MVLIGACGSALIGRMTHAAGSSDASLPLPSSTVVTAESQSAEHYHIHDSSSTKVHHSGAGATAPETIAFRGAIFTRNDLIPTPEDDLIAVNTRRWWMYLCGSIFCVSLAALAAGLTIGLVSIDPFDLALIQATEEEDCSNEEEVRELRVEKHYANKLLPLVQQHHLLLVTLLICNSFANELLPLLLDKLIPSYMAVIVSVTFVLVFGEILPSSIFTGPNQLRYASYLVPLVYVLLTALFVLAWPIAWVLDRILGVEEETRMRRSELKSLIRLQANQQQGSGGANVAVSPTSDVEAAEWEHSHGHLSIDEMNLLHGALELKDKTIRDAMVQLDDVFMLSLDTVLDLDQLARLVHQGHSRIPVFDGDRQNVRGVLLVKRLIVLNPEDKRPLRSIAFRWPLICSPDLGLLALLNSFQDGRSHMAIVCDKPAVMMAALRAEIPVPDDCRVMGIITIEDVFELLLKEEIMDETDLGVRQQMEHAQFVQRRIKRLKSLAASMKSPVITAAVSRGVSKAGGFRRTHSIASRLASDATFVRAISSTNLLGVSSATTSPTLSAITPTPNTAAPPSVSSFGYQASAAADETKVDIMENAPTRRSSLVAISTITTSPDEGSPAVALPEHFPLVSGEGSASRLLRDDAFTKRHARTPTAANASPFASFVPQHASSSVAASPSPASSVLAHESFSHLGPRRTGSVLTPRTQFTSDALTRRDLDSTTLSMIKRLSNKPPDAPHVSTVHSAVRTVSVPAQAIPHRTPVRTKTNAAAPAEPPTPVLAEEETDRLLDEHTQQQQQ